MNRLALPTRAAALFAAVATTALLVGSQLGIADHCTGQADALLAARRGTPVAQPASATLLAQRRPG